MASQRKVLANDTMKELKYILLIMAGISILGVFYYLGRQSVHIPPQQVVRNDSLLYQLDSIKKINTSLLFQIDDQLQGIKKLENEKKRLSNQIASYTISELFYYFQSYASENGLDSESVKIDYH